MVGELGHHHMCKQPGSGDALVDHLGGHRRLGQCFALAAGPLASHMQLNCEHPRRVIQFLADVFADALELAAADTFGAFRLGTNSPQLQVAANCLNLRLNPGLVPVTRLNARLKAA